MFHKRRGAYDIHWLDQSTHVLDLAGQGIGTARLSTNVCQAANQAKEWSSTSLT
ncbi:hypothetical protein IFR05_017422, partial [Cadophora sp. M221]